MSTEKPLPSLDKESDWMFWTAAAAERLLVQSCEDCDQKQMIPRSGCQYCGSDRIEFMEASGVGHVYTYTVIRRESSLPAFEVDVPYVVAIIELEEGVRIYSNVVECEPPDVELGMPVAVSFEHVGEHIALPKFRPLE